MRALTTAVVLALASVSAAEARQSAALRDALMAAVRPALPFPEASNDGTPSGDDPGPLWTVHWPAEDSAVVEVLANPLNAENRARALKAEAAIQKAAMQSQPPSWRHGVEPPVPVVPATPVVPPPPPVPPPPSGFGLRLPPQAARPTTRPRTPRRFEANRMGKLA